MRPSLHKMGKYSKEYMETKAITMDDMDEMDEMDEIVTHECTDYVAEPEQSAAAEPAMPGRAGAPSGRAWAGRHG